MHQNYPCHYSPIDGTPLWFSEVVLQKHNLAYFYSCRGSPTVVSVNFKLPQHCYNFNHPHFFNPTVKPTLPDVNLYKTLPLELFIINRSDQFTFSLFGKTQSLKTLKTTLN